MSEIHYMKMKSINLLFYTILLLKPKKNVNLKGVKYVVIVFAMIKSSTF